MTIDVTCSRCGARYMVPNSKAGKKGRCPACGGMIHVPLVPGRPGPQPLAQLRKSKLIPGIVLAAALLVAIYCILQVSKQSATVQPGQAIPPTDVSDKLKLVETKLYQIENLEDRVKKYQELCTLERRLRARDVLLKVRNYEPVSNDEYDLRKKVLEEYANAAKSQPPASGAERKDWQLDTPLTPAERAELTRVSNELQQQSKDLVEDLNDIGIVVAPTTDPLRRTLLNGDQAAAKVTDRKASLLEYKASLMQGR